MTTAAELTVISELAALRENAALLRWTVNQIDPTTFVIGFTAQDRSKFWCKVSCDGYKAQPPAWHWFNPETDAVDQNKDIPNKGGFFHGAGVICAPWNRLAYKTVDARGPHDDWSLGDWLTNPKTGACRSLSAMALRIHHELQSGMKGRMAA